MKATFGIMAVLLMAAVCLVPMVDAEETTNAAFTPIEGDRVLGVSDKGTYTIMYNNPRLADMVDTDISIEYTAKLVNSNGETQSSAVSPSSGDLNNGESAEIEVTAPKTAGSYTLKVEFVCEATPADEDAEKYKDTSSTEYKIKVVNPITLSVTLKATGESILDPSGVGVFFFVDGEKKDDSYTTFTMSSNGTATVSYKLVADLSSGAHTFKVVSADGSEGMIEGLGEEHTFYIGDNSYTALTALVIVVVILLIVIMVWVYRKPVKNFGKPKSRR